MHIVAVLEFLVHPGLPEVEIQPTKMEEDRPAPSHSILYFCVRELGTKSETFCGGAIKGVSRALRFVDTRLCSSFYARFLFNHAVNMASLRPLRGS